VEASTIDLGIDQTALVQEFVPARDGHITRIETLGAVIFTASGSSLRVRASTSVPRTFARQLMASSWRAWLVRSTRRKADFRSKAIRRRRK
jgi:hypothetical protein